MKRITCSLSILAVAAAFGQQPPIRIDTDITGGWSSWGLSGNGNKFRQYATAPRGIFLGSLNLGLTDDLRNDARFVLKAPGQDDYRLSGLIRLNAGTTRIMATDFRNRFLDSDPAISQVSERRVSEGFLWQKLTPNFAISFRTRQDKQNQTVSEPSETLNQDTRTWNASARGSLWHNGFVDLSYTDTHYTDHTAVLRDTTTQSFSAGVLQQVGDSFALTGAIARSYFRQPGVATDEVDEWNLGGKLLLGEDTSLFLDYRNERLAMPSVLQSYDRSHQQARVRLVRRLGNGWSAQAGYNQLALERLSDDHNFVNVPRLHTVDVQFGGPLSRSAQMTATVSREFMQGGAQMQTPDPRGLYWTSRWDAQIKLSAHNALASTYAVFDWHQNRNSERDVTVRRQGLVIGAEWDLKPELACYAEISTDQWTGHTSDPLSPDLNSFFPDATTLTLGANWTIDKRTWATGNYSFFNVQNVNPLGLRDGLVWSSMFTGTLHYKASKNCEFGLTIAPWQYTDTLIQSGSFSTGLVRLTAKAKF
jgi:hypothetical protein